MGGGKGGSDFNPKGKSDADCGVADNGKNHGDDGRRRRVIR